MKVLYEGVGSPCDLCMYECGSKECDEAGPCIKPGTNGATLLDYYFTEDKEQGMTVLSILFWFTWVCLCIVLLSVIYMTDALPRFVLWVMHKFHRR